MGVIVDVFGNPIDQGALTEQISAADVTGVRSIWQTSLGEITPDRLVDILERSINHDPRDYLLLAEKMEETNGHYFSVLGTRKLAVEAIDVEIEAASDEAFDKKIADAVRELFKLECVDNSRVESLDALGKSFSVSEIIWDTSEKQWMPQKIQHRLPEWFTYDRETQNELRLRDKSDPLNGLALKPYKFIVHRPRLKSGLPIRNGLARIAGFADICLLYAQKDWMAFAEVFGMPVRVGVYGPNASPKDISILRRAVANIGTDAACVIPQSMKIDFNQVGNVSGGGDLFERLTGYLERQISKIVLGQTMTTDAQSAGMGSKNAEIHNEVRGDIRDADGKQLALTYKRDLVIPFVTLNFGPQKRYPNVVIRKKKPEDLKQLTDSLDRLVPLGLKVEQSVIRDKLGLPDPAPDAEEKDNLLRPQTVASIPPADRADDPAARALNSAQNRTALRDEVDRLVDLALDGWQEQIEPIVSAVEQLANECSTPEEFMQRLPSLMSEVEPDELLRGLAVATFKARGLGNATDAVILP